MLLFPGIVISAYANLGALNQGEWIHLYIETNGIPIKGFLATALVDMCSKCGEIEKGIEIFNNTVEKDVSTWNSIIGGLSINGYGEKALSPFAMMWNALFSWMTSSSLAYIYGRDDSFHEEYMYINGREYPSKVVLPNGCSLEIKKTLAGCLSCALPGLIADLKLPTPLYTLEQGLACLLETMSFMDGVPPLRLKQWQVIVLLFIDALSVCRIPGLTPPLTSRRILIPKILSRAQISPEEYKIMKDMVIPLGRVPQFSMQSGG